MFRFAEKDAIQCKAIVNARANVDAISVSMVTNVNDAFHCRVVSMAHVMCHLNAYAIKAGMDFSVRNVCLLYHTRHLLHEIEETIN